MLIAQEKILLKTSKKVFDIFTCMLYNACARSRRLLLTCMHLSFAGIEFQIIPLRITLIRADFARLLFYFSDRREQKATIANWRCVTIANKEVMLNEEIRLPEVRVIDTDGTPLGFMSSDEANDLAADRDLDLVLIAPNATPPVCKIMDYSKYLFEQTKKEKEARKNQKVIEIKEVKLSPKIEQHDFDVRVKAATKFLKEGNKVKASIRFKGRAIQYTNMGMEVMNQFYEALADIAVQDKKPSLDGRNMFMMLSAKKD